MKLRLIVDVEYEPRGVTRTELIYRLNSIANYAASGGLFTGLSDAEVVGWASAVLDRSVAPSDDEPHVVITGDPVGGFEFIGPFASARDAAEFGNNDACVDTPEWWIAPLHSKEEPEVPVDGAEFVRRCAEAQRAAETRPRHRSPTDLLGLRTRNAEDRVRLTRPGSEERAEAESDLKLCHLASDRAALLLRAVDDLQGYCAIVNGEGVNSWLAQEILGHLKESGFL